MWVPAVILILHVLRDFQPISVKLGGHKSEWLTISKIAPQGSIFRPFVYNLFQNDLLSQQPKAARGINALSRIPGCLDYTAKICLFRSFVKCYVDYCPIVWHFCNISDIRKIEKYSQYHALRFVCNDFKSTYAELRTKCKRSLMYIQRQRAILLEVCKLQLNIGPTYPQTLFQSVTHSYDMRQNGKLTCSRAFVFSDSAKDQSTISAVYLPYRYNKLYFDICDVYYNFWGTWTLRNLTSLYSYHNVPSQSIP